MWDKFVKTVTLFAFRILARLRPPRPEPLPRQARRILVFSTTGLGDGLFDSAAIRSLKMGHPGAKLIVCAHRKRPLMALHNPFVDEVVPYGKSPLIQFRLLWRFRREKPDLVVVLHANEEVFPLAYCINRRAVVALCHPGDRFAFLAAHPVTVRETLHAVLLPLKVAEFSGGSPEDPRMIYEVKADEISAMQSRFPDWIHRHFVVFQCGGGKTLSWRDWPVSHYVEVIRWLQSHFPHTVVLTGGTENSARANAMEEACGGVINLAGRTTFAETAALLKLATMLFTTDTGVMHLGFAVDCRVVSLFHHLNPAAIYGPLKKSARNVTLELPFSRTMKAPSARDMEGISCEEVRQAIQGMLSVPAGTEPGTLRT